MPAAYYVKVGADYIRFTNNGQYSTTKSRMAATSFARKSDIVTACRKAKIEDFKIVPSTVHRI